MKKLLFFTHYLVGGGAEKTIANLATYINEQVEGYEAHIAVFFDDEVVHKELKNVHVLKHCMPQGISKFRKIPLLLQQVKDLKKLKKELKIDVCISFLPGADFLNALSKGQEKMILSVRNKESFFVKNKFRKYYIQYCYRKSDKIISISERVRGDIINYFGVKGEKVKTIYNPTPLVIFTGELAQEFEDLFKQNKKIVITAGRLTEQKGQKYLIRAFRQVANKIKDAHLVILGKGELEGELKTLVKELQLENNVTFLGFVRNPHDYIKKSDVFAFSSIVEGLGNILVETLACETPIVSTDCDCGPREILAPNSNWDYFTDKVEYAEYGVLVPVQGESEMAEGIIELLQNDEMREKYRISSGKRLDDFKIENIVKQWLLEFENCVKY